MSIRYAKALFALAGVLFSCMAAAVTYTDNFTGKTANLQWTALNDACLTAGDGSGSIPACPTTSPYPASDTPGQGALLLTPAANHQTGAILSAFAPFPLSQGIQITFTTYTFGGDSGGLAKNGADGIVFFLTDGTQNPPATTGAEGGSMGYDCSNVNAKYDGVAYGYLGLGIDEFGNFLNTGDNGTNPQSSPTKFNGGIYNSNDPNGSTANGTNTYYTSNSGTIASGTGPQYQPERIGLRGAGNTNMAGLALMPGSSSAYYSGSAIYNNGVTSCNKSGTSCQATQGNKVWEACRSGTYVTAFKTVTKGGVTYQVATATKPITYNYNAIPGGYAVLPDNEPIANNSKTATRNPTPSTPPSDIAWPITYRLTIAPNGLLNFAYSYNNGDFQPVLTNEDITQDNGPLPASLRFGFSAGTGGDNNVHEITCFQASPLQANGSAGSNTLQGGKVLTNTQFYLASYSTNNWWGSLVADPLSIAKDGTLSISSTANWDAKCVLTGGPCDTMAYTSGNTTVTPNVTVQAPANRTLLTWNNGGVSLEWGSLSTSEQGVLNTAPNGSTDNQGQQRLAWLRGVRSVEQLQNPPGNLRARTYVLGDIIDSSPTFVGAPTPLEYLDKFKDNLYPSTANPENAPGAQAFSAFAAAEATRENVVYVGGNDGLVHGFEAGSYKANGTYDASTNDGKELLGYMPYGVLNNKVVNLANPLYRHDYLVDATPTAGDLFYGNAWHTWLVGGVGSTGQEIYALDITNASNFSESNASNLVIGDWSSATPGLSHLGNTVGSPIIARLHNGDWAIIFGNGLGSTTTAGVYIGLVNPSTGSVTFQFLDTGVGSSTNPDGIAYVSSVDLDGDGIADYLYAGDTQGNVWRFDVTSNLPSNWHISKFGNGSPTPLFVATDSKGNPQPITTSITLLAVQTGVGTKVTRDMLFFGTGEQTPATTTHGVQYAKGTSSNGTAQTFYGIWDWDMSAWNAMSSVQYASLTAPQTITRSNLLAQSVVATGTGTSGGQTVNYRTLSNTKVVCWQNTTDCPGGSSVNDQFGWMFDLPDPGPTTGPNAGDGEQIIYNPVFLDGAMVINTAIPPVISAQECNPGLQSGWTMAFNPATGGGFQQDFFPLVGGGGGSGSSISGIQLAGTGTPTAIQYGSKSYLATQTVPNVPALSQVNPPPNDVPARVSWRELVNP